MSMTMTTTRAISTTWLCGVTCLVRPVVESVVIDYEARIGVLDQFPHRQHGVVWRNRHHDIDINAINLTVGAAFGGANVQTIAYNPEPHLRHTDAP
jgi:hypothetical protein